MEKVFHVRSDDDKWGSFEIDAIHKWEVGGVECVMCGRTWANTGLAYPAVNLGHLPSAEGYFARVHSVEALNKLIDPIRPMLPPHCVILPGTSFGPYCGTAKGCIGDLVLPMPWTLLVRGQALEKLRSAGIQNLVGVPAELQFLKKTRPEQFYELQIEPYTILAGSRSCPPESSPSCRTCGYQEIQAPARIVLRGTSLPANQVLFRGRDLTTYIFATESFMETAHQLGLTGVLFEEVEIER